MQNDKVKYKKYIYALRPLLACKFIEDNHSIPPVKFEELIKQNIPIELSEEIQRMLLIKAKSDEKALNQKLPVIQSYIEDKIIRYQQISKNMADDRLAEWDTLDKVFLRIVE